MKFEIEQLITAQFDHLNFKLSHSGLYGVIGRNGSGKSTLFTIINGEMKIIGGHIQILEGKYQGRVVYVPNLEIFDKNLNGYDYIKLLKGKELQRANELMPKFQAERFFKKSISKWSLGMQEILAFILTMSLDSDLIIIDELMNGLDDSMRTMAFQILKEVSKEKIILLTSHILEEVEKYCDEVYFLTKASLNPVSNFEEAKKLIMENKVFI